MGKSIQGLAQQLSHILSPYQNEGPLLAKILRTSIKTTILLCPPPDEDTSEYRQDTSLLPIGWLGGSPRMPKSMRWPETRQGEKLLFIAQLDFGTLSKLAIEAPQAFPANTIEDLPNTGSLILFRTAGRARENIKDRYSFALLYTKEAIDSEHMREVTRGSVSPVAQPLYPRASFSCPLDNLWLDKLLNENFPHLTSDLVLKQNLMDWFNTFYECATEGALGHIRSVSRNDLDTLQHMASFSASGVGFSETRKDDWHYKHLAQEAANFELLFSFVEKDNACVDCIMMRQEDLKERLFERAWLFCRPT